MNYFLRRFFCILIFCVLFFVSACSQLDNEHELKVWSGEYQWGSTYPPSVSGGIALIESYTIIIYEENQLYFADFSANGHQLGIYAKLKVTGTKESIDLTFSEYLSDNTQKPFESEDIVLRLTNTGQVITTKWMCYGPRFGMDVGVEGIYFVKAS